MLCASSRVSEFLHEDGHYRVCVRMRTPSHVVQVGALEWTIINEYTNVVVMSCLDLPFNGVVILVLVMAGL